MMTKIQEATRNSAAHNGEAGDPTMFRARSVAKTFVTTDPPTPELKGIDLGVWV